MKYRFIGLLIVLLSLSVDAQEPKTLVSGDVSVTGFGGPLLDFASFNGNTELWNGGAGAALFNGQFYLGGFGSGLATNPEFSFIDIDSNTVIADVEAGFGGVWLGWIPLYDRVVHPYVDVMTGWGGYSFGPDNEQQTDLEYYNDNVFVVLPRIGLEVNVLSWVRLNASVGYKWVNGLEVPMIYQDYIHPNQNGAVYSIGLRLGKFY